MSCKYENCTGLTDIYCHIEEPLTIDSSVFYEVPTNTLHASCTYRKQGEIPSSGCLEEFPEYH